MQQQIVKSSPKFIATLVFGEQKEVGFVTLDY